MRIAGRAAASWRILLLSLFWVAVSAKEEQPSVKYQEFKHPPLNINYFDDSDVTVFHDIEERNIYRIDNSQKDAKWTTVKGIPDGYASMLVMHPYEPKTAFVLTQETKHYKTTDRGETWSEFSSGTYPSPYQAHVLVFHADDTNRIIFNGIRCEGLWCDAEEATYTTDGFKSHKTLRSSTAGCWWAKSTKEFSTGQASIDKDRTLCITSSPMSLFKDDQRLSISDDFFESVSGTQQEFEPNLDTNKGVSGIVNLATVKKFILVAAASPNSDEMALYVTDDTIRWHRAIFPSADNHDHSHQINQESYTVLESTNYSIQVDVMTSHPSRPMGVLFTSNSNGTFFTENLPYTNRNTKGHVDFEKISGIQGVFLVNKVENGKEVDEKGAEKVVVTEITFDDGRTFQEISADKDRVHLHSVTQLDNTGRVFSSPAPGLIMGNGNTGKSLSSFADSNLFVSDDAGMTWSKALDGPHKYEFGDSGSILIAIKDSKKEDITEFSYSLNHGEKWESVTLPGKLSIKPDILTTASDSTSPKFLLLGEHERVYYMFSIDFTALDKRKCDKDKDMEDWYARVDKDGKPTCIMGHKQTYRRRKKDADCFVLSNWEDPVAKTENCECTDADFECDYNFQRDAEDRSVCKQVGAIPIPEGSCPKEDGNFKGSSGWRLIPGDTCTRKDGPQKDDTTERKCSEGGSSDGGSKPPSAPADGAIKHTKVEFDTKFNDFDKFYLDRGDAKSGANEVVIARPSRETTSGREIDSHLWRTTDQGKTWKPILEKEDVRSIYQHEVFKEVVFFTTTKEKVIYTIDRGQSFHSFDAPSKPASGVRSVNFHPDKKDWLIWIGEACDEISGSDQCYLQASISTDRGDNWRTMLRFVSRCEFTGNSAYKFTDRSIKQIVCLAHKEENSSGDKTLVTSNDFFSEDKTYYEGTVENMATMSEFILISSEDKKAGGLDALASINGKHFESARFPHNFHETHQSSYTVLDSSSHAINLFVGTQEAEGHKSGSIIKSNSNGTTYVLSASHVNSNDNGYVDFEKVKGLEGLVLINIVANPDKKKEKKILQTKISHNDGSEWDFLKPPQKNGEGKSYNCGSGDEKCALHLHHYTERDDKSRTFAASAAVGLLFGVGNVGSKLEDIKDADTFLSTNGGIDWEFAKKGHWTWQYGDQGSIIVLVQRATHGNNAKTKTVSYSTDEGKTWKEYQFADEEVTVVDLTTVESGTSRNFIVWCSPDKGKPFAVNIDFTGLTNRACKFSEEGKSDYDLWSPQHPNQENPKCLFGHVATYLRKKPTEDCYNDQDLQRLHKFENCECSRRDYECAFNFELDNHGQCGLVPGYQPLSGSDWCKQNPNETSYFEPTGYRRVPLTTCKGGREWDKTSTEHACDGHEEEFEKSRQTSGWTIFFAVIIPVAAAGAIGWFVWRNWSGKFGQIRLGETSATFDSDQPWIKYPVIAISAVAAVVAALPLVATSLWRAGFGAYERVRGERSGGWLPSNSTRRFTTRDSFARGRGDYTMVDDDEGELLGEDSDEEV